MKSITIAGNVGKDAELRRTGGVDPVLNFSVAVEDRSSKEKSTFWFDVSVWGKRGETLEQYIKKGSRVAVSGDLTRREYDGKTFLGVKADNVSLLGGGERDDDNRGQSSQARAADRAQRPTGGAPAGDPYGTGDEIPFAPEWR
jgi:single-strand DNA-binding protein